MSIYACVSTGILRGQKVWDPLELELQAAATQCGYWELLSGPL